MINYHIMFTSENIKFWHISVIFTVPESISMMHSIMLLISTCPRNGVPSKLWEKKPWIKMESLLLKFGHDFDDRWKTISMHSSVPSIVSIRRNQNRHIFFIIQINVKCPIKSFGGNPYNILTKHAESIG